MSNKLSDRVASYQDASDYKLLNRLPIIICINGRSFSKTTSLLKKPYDESFAECILSTTLKLCSEIDGAIFAYQHNDEIVIVARNDQTTDTNPWFDNKIQKICSVTSSIATSHFSKCANAIDLNLNEPIFTSQVFVTPSVIETVNTMIYKQQQNFHTSIQYACFYELLKKYNKITIDNMLNGLSIDNKIDLLNQECGIDFNDYPMAFRRGVAFYKIPKVVTNGIMKNKWNMNAELPIFTKDHSFLVNIIKNGTDIFRTESFQ
jgi:tRNA(His) guanylyltransferase